MIVRKPADKVRNRAAAKNWRDSIRGSVVFTNGVFDLLHPGHIDVLNAARSEGDSLVVGINSDDSVRRLKGPTRPIRSELDRAFVVAALECVDCVVVFDDDTPLELITALRPDVVVKGGDYNEDTVVGAKEAKSWKGRVVIVPLTPGHSTTSIIEKLSGQD